MKYVNESRRLRLQNREQYTVPYYLMPRMLSKLHDGFRLDSDEWIKLLIHGLVIPDYKKR
jgi:hypothetical protein